METFSALLAICVGNSPVPGEFPTQRPVTRSFDVYFDMRPNKRLSKQSGGWWFETQSRPLWRHRNDNLQVRVDVLIWTIVPRVYNTKPLSSKRHDREILSVLLVLCEEIYQYPVDSTNKRPVMWSADVPYDIALFKQLNKPWSCWRFDTSWRSYSVTLMIQTNYQFWSMICRRTIRNNDGIENFELIASCALP